MIFREAKKQTIDLLATQGGYGDPLASWARELEGTQASGLVASPIVVDLLVGGLATAFCDQYTTHTVEGLPGGLAGAEAVVAAMQTSVMSRTSCVESSLYALPLLVVLLGSM